MKKFFVAIVLLIVVFSYTILSCVQHSLVPEKAIEKVLLQQIDSFAEAKDQLLIAVKSGNDAKHLQQLFLQTRIAYKKIEWAAEYFLPPVSKSVNGAPVEEIERYDGVVFPPAGLQVIEQYLFPNYDTSKKKEIIEQLDRLQTSCDKYKSYFTHIDIFNWQVLDAAKLEVFRILTLGISGFDAPIAQNSIRESATSLRNVKNALAYYAVKEHDDSLSQLFDKAIQYLDAPTDFNDFNRANFITQYANPLTKGITALEVQLKMHPAKYNRLLNQNASTLFDTDAFNVNSYVFDQYSFVTKEKIELGKMLFSDPILSGNGKRSCQSCHQPGKAFTDGVAKNMNIKGDNFIRRNTPTLLNAALQPFQFDDIRVISLEDQAAAVIENPEEMHGSVSKATKQLWQDKKYREMFARAFPKKDRTSIDSFEVLNAIGSYIRTLVALNSRFDEYMRGNKAAMTEEEVAGFNIFMGKAKCGTCHYMPLFNGAFPPMYTQMETETIGVPQTATGHEIDTDMGRYNIIKRPSQMHSFKVTTVRNAALTAPYMHNGVFTTLEEVVDFYNKGGGAGLGMKLDNQTLPTDKLNLTEKESTELVAFIKSLNSR